MKISGSERQRAERHWESADGKKKTVQIVIFHSKAKEVLAKMTGGRSGGHLGTHKTIDKFRQRYCWLHLGGGGVERWCQQCDTCDSSPGPRTRSRGLMHKYNVGAPFESIEIDIAGPFAERGRENRHLLIAMGYFTQ